MLTFPPFPLPPLADLFSPLTYFSTFSIPSSSSYRPSTYSPRPSTSSFRPFFFTSKLLYCSFRPSSSSSKPSSYYSSDTHPPPLLSQPLLSDFILPPLSYPISPKTFILCSASCSYMSSFSFSRLFFSRRPLSHPTHTPVSPSSSPFSSFPHDPARSHSRRSSCVCNLKLLRATLLKRVAAALRQPGNVTPENKLEGKCFCVDHGSRYCMAGKSPSRCVCVWGGVSMCE